MNKYNEQLETLAEIRSLMERSSRFISLSGLSGVFAGIFALIGALAAYLYLDLPITSPGYYELKPVDEVSFFFLADALFVLSASMAVCIILSIRKAKQKGLSVWDASAKRMLMNLMIPLISGGIFCLILYYHGFIGLIVPVTLIFYGLALINASKYTLNDIRFLGIVEIILGLIASVYMSYGLLFWAVGFGILHIIYGIVLYNKYEK
jgi:hypothetical protein